MNEQPGLRQRAAATSTVDPQGGRSLFVVSGSLMAGLLSPLADRLHDEHGISSILIAPDRGRLPSSKIYNFSADSFTQIVTLEDVFEPTPVVDLLGGEDLADRAANIERRLGVTILNLIRADRHFGREFITGNWIYRSRFAKRYTHEQSLDVAMRLVEYFEEMIAVHRPLAVLGYPGTLFSSALIDTAEAKGIPMLGLCAPRRGNFFYWQGDRYGKPRKFDDAYARNVANAASTADVEITISGSPERIVRLRKRISSQRSLVWLLRRFYSQARKSLPNYIRRRPPGFGEYTVASRLTYEWLAWIWRRRALRNSVLDAGLSPGTPFVFFPLSMEPEASLLVESPWADFQLGMIDMLAKTLPAGWRLVVKEHPAQGIPRYLGFREQLGRYPNVLEAAVLDPAEPYVEGAKAIFTINGTIGMQAASIGKPVLTMHRKYLMLCMPHVRLVETYEDVFQAFRDIQNGRFPATPECVRAYEAFGKALAEYEFPIEDRKLLAGAPSESIGRSADFGRIYGALCDALDLGHDADVNATVSPAGSGR